VRALPGIDIIDRFSEVADWQQIGLAGGEPVLCCRALALRTTAVATRVVGNPVVAAVLAVELPLNHRRARHEPDLAGQPSRLAV